MSITDSRRIGDLDLPPIGLGCMGMSIAYGERDEPGSIETIHHALDRGVTLIDTADMYGAGHNEELVGRALKGRRDEAILATKFGNTRDANGKPDVRGDAAYVAQACEASLKRLGVETIDLYYLHRVDDRVPIEETVGAMSRLVEEGKVRHLGLSEAGPATIERAQKVHRISALQTEYSLWTRDVEAEILPTCRRLGIGFVAYSPLGRGFLTGTIGGLSDLIEKDRRRDHPRFSQENIAANAPLVAKLTAIADRLGAAPAQVALAWLLSRGEDIVAIPGTKKVKWLDQNIAACDLRLDAVTLAELDAAFPPGVTAGLRYPAGSMRRLGL